jgi:hypothetical protein
MALWNLLGGRPVTMLAWESFGEGWVTDVVKQLRLDPQVLRAPYGELPDLAAVDMASDVVFTWNGTTSGVRVPDGDWIATDRAGLTICDATSAAFAQPLRSTNSMSSPSPGRKCWAARARTASSSSPRARWNASSSTCRLGRSPRSSASPARAS